MTDSLNDQVIAITGASRGIGATTARHLARLGARVVIGARSIDALERLAKEINAADGTALAMQLDVTRFSEVEAFVARARKEFGRLDVLINNAGTIDPIARIADSDPEAWSRVADINYKGVYYGLRAAIPYMLEQDQGGTIINLSSGAATSALEGWSHYSSTKAAVLMLTQCAHKEYGEHNIRVVGLSPGTVATEMQTTIRESGINPVSKLDPSAHISTEWAARAIAFLCRVGAKEFAGSDFSIKNDEGRRRVGLIE